MCLMPRLLAFVAAVALGGGSSAAVARGASETSAAIWQALKKGDHVVLLRHTETVPGIGDPPGYKLNDCATQRNLSELGRQHAIVWGKAFTANGVSVGGVFTSVWCRCVDTAKLAFGRTDTWPALNSHFESPQFASLQAEQVKGGIPARMKKGKALVLVTHQVNISAITGITPAMGEAVVMKFADKTFSVVGTLKVQ